jgi:hypothetical protein
MKEPKDSHSKQLEDTRYSFHKARGQNQAAIDLIKKGIWVYFLLLVFEGALRRWVLPSLATPLLIVRDPVAIVLLAYAWYYNLFPKSIFITLMVVITVISIFTTLFLGHGNLFVTFYGARLYLIHFPLIFLIGSLLNRNDVLKYGRAILWISIPMAVLVCLQFYSPQSAWVNRGVGGDMSGAGFGAGMGYFRPPATFSFTNGTTSFFSLVAAFVFYFWLRPGQINKIVLVSATIGLLLAVPFSISRMLAFTVVVMALFTVMTLSRNPKFIGKIVAGFIAMGVLAFALSFTELLDKPLEVFLNRFEVAGESEGGNLEGTIGNRYFGGMIHAIVSSVESPFFGEGLGMGTNAGAALLGAHGTFLISEGEWGRVVGEMGALLGLAVIAIRLIISFKVAVASWFKIREGDVLSWMLLSFMLLIFPQGQWAQPTILGFSTLITGLLIASFNNDEENNIDVSSEPNTS